MVKHVTDAEWRNAVIQKGGVQMPSFVMCDRYGVMFSIRWHSAQKHLATHATHYHTGGATAFYRCKCGRNLTQTHVWGVVGGEQFQTICPSCNHREPVSLSGGVTHMEIPWRDPVAHNCYPERLS